MEKTGFSWKGAKEAAGKAADKITVIPVDKRNVLLHTHWSLLCLLKHPVTAEAFLGKLQQNLVITDNDLSALQNTKQPGRQLLLLQTILRDKTQQQADDIAKTASELAQSKNFRQEGGKLLKNFADAISAAAGDLPRTHKSAVPRSA